MRSDLIALAERVEACGKTNNPLDVEVEIALFIPSSVYSAARANNAGTKVIYTDRANNEVTCWSEDWTITRKMRETTAAALRARANQEPGQ